MEYSKNNSDQAGRPPKAGKRSSQDRRWTVLFIGNHGRTITLKRFKGMVILSLIVLVLSIGVSAGLLVWNQKIIVDNHDLKDDFKNVNQRLDTLQHDKDILMTRLVLAETKIQECSGGKAGESAGNKLSSQKPPGPAKDDKLNPSVAEIMAPPTPKQAESQQNSAPIGSGLSVDVEDFQISNHSGDNRLRVLFKVKNTSPNSKLVSGHAIVVLKGEQTGSLPIPWTPLVDGRPTGKKRGHSFAIKYFKTMRVSTRSPEFAEKFQTASVYVFTKEGELLLEKGFSIKLPPN